MANSVGGFNLLPGGQPVVNTSQSGWAQTPDQTSALGMAQLAAQGKMPSAADYQMRAGLQQAQAAAGAQAASTRGAFGLAGAQHAAQATQAGLAQQAVNQAAQLRAQEQATALGQYGQFAGQARSQDLEGSNIASQQAMQQAQLAQQQQTANQGMSGNLFGAAIGTAMKVAPYAMAFSDARAKTEIAPPSNDLAGAWGRAYGAADAQIQGARAAQQVPQGLRDLDVMRREALHGIEYTPDEQRSLLAHKASSLPGTVSLSSIQPSGRVLEGLGYGQYRDVASDAPSVYHDMPVGTSRLVEPGGPSQWTLREEPDFILAVNDRTGKMGKLDPKPLTENERKQAMAPHGAGPITTHHDESLGEGLGNVWSNFMHGGTPPPQQAGAAPAAASKAPEAQAEQDHQPIGNVAAYQTADGHWTSDATPEEGAPSPGSALARLAKDPVSNEQLRAQQQYFSPGGGMSYDAHGASEPAEAAGPVAWQPRGLTSDETVHALGWKNGPGGGPAGSSGARPTWGYGGIQPESDDLGDLERRPAAKGRDLNYGSEAETQGAGNRVYQPVSSGQAAERLGFAKAAPMYSDARAKAEAHDTGYLRGVREATDPRFAQAVSRLQPVAPGPSGAPMVLTPRGYVQAGNAPEPNPDSEAAGARDATNPANVERTRSLPPVIQNAGHTFVLSPSGYVPGESGTPPQAAPGIGQLSARRSATPEPARTFNDATLGPHYEPEFPPDYTHAHNRRATLQEQLRQLQDQDVARDKGQMPASGAVRGGEAGATSDARAKDMDMKHSGFAAAREFLDTLQPHAFTWARPELAPNANAAASPNIGVYAQEVERSPWGKAIVQNDPRTGLKTLDQHALMGALAASAGALKKQNDDHALRIQELERAMGTRR